MRMLTVAILLAGCGAQATTCRVTQDHLDVWRGTVEGPNRLTDTVADPSQPLEIRQAAAAALLTLDRREVDPGQLLAGALAGDDGSVAEGLVEPLVAALGQAGEAEDARTPSYAQQRTQVRAKELALVVRPRVSPEAQDQLRDAVMAWYVQDLVERQDLGNHRLPVVLSVFGPRAGELLLEALTARKGPRAMVVAAESIVAVADPALRQAAAERLRAAETYLDSPEFSASIATNVREPLVGRGARPAEERIEELVRINREHFFTTGLLGAMEHLCAVPMVAEQLAIIARSIPVGVTADAVETRQYRARQVLEECVPERHAEPSPSAR